MQSVNHITPKLKKKKKGDLSDAINIKLGTKIACKFSDLDNK